MRNPGPKTHDLPFVRRLVLTIEDREIEDGAFVPVVANLLEDYVSALRAGTAGCDAVETFEVRGIRMQTMATSEFEAPTRPLLTDRPRPEYEEVALHRIDEPTLPVAGGTPGRNE